MTRRYSTVRPISETFIGQPTFSSLSAGGYAVYAYAFESVSALAMEGMTSPPFLIPRVTMFTKAIQRLPA